MNFIKIIRKTFRQIHVYTVLTQGKSSIFIEQMLNNLFFLNRLALDLKFLRQYLLRQWLWKSTQRLFCCIPKIQCYPIIYYAFRTQWVTFLTYLSAEIAYYPLTFYCFTMKKEVLLSFKVSVFTDQKTFRNVPEDVNLHNLCLKHKSEIHAWNINFI